MNTPSVQEKKIMNYFKSNKFQFTVGVSNHFIRNLLGVVNLEMGGLSIIYITALFTPSPRFYTTFLNVQMNLGLSVNEACF